MQLPLRKTLKGLSTAAPAYLPQAPRGSILDTARQQKIKGAAHQALEALASIKKPPAGTPAAAAEPAEAEKPLAAEEQSALGSSSLEGAANGADAARNAAAAAALGSSSGDQHTGGVVKQLQHEAGETGAEVDDGGEELQPLGGRDQPAAGLGAGVQARLLGCCGLRDCDVADRPTPELQQMHQPM